MEVNIKKTTLRLMPNYRTALIDGSLVPNSPKHMTTEEFYYASKGNKIEIHNKEYEYVVAEYSLERDPKYIYTYQYQKEENWSTYTGNVEPTEYHSKDYTFSNDCYFRVCVKRVDGEDISKRDIEISHSIFTYICETKEYHTPSYFAKEIEDTVEKLRREESSDTLFLCLLTDTHYTVNGTWEDTANNIHRVAEEVSYDAIVHLGDMTDGMLSKYMTKQYVNKMRKDLEAIGVPVYNTLGNHDSNYFYNESNMFTPQEMKVLYKLYGSEEIGKQKQDTVLDYYVDVPGKRVRMIFLSSFDHEEAIRYGYKEEQLHWLTKILCETPKNNKVIIFSHEAPVEKLDYWSPLVRNGEELLDILEAYNSNGEHQIIGFFYGHTHADYIWNECSFPVISVGCNKLEYFTEKKPRGAVAYPRKEKDVTQDLWDSLIIDFNKEELKLVRFGAGEDRKISFAKKQSSYKQRKREERLNRKVKIWAHRGASGYAPENTMEAFKLAEKIGADGIELDVQFSKDGVPVIIHDERIDRVCNGTGWVKDYTVEELKQFNANKKFANWGEVQIPTLEEFYCWVKDTDLLVNLELKNSEILYEGLEEKVLTLAKRYAVENKILYSSFNHCSMKKLKALDTNAETAFLYMEQLVDAHIYGANNRVTALHPYHKCITDPKFIQDCHEKGIQVNVWTVNEDEDIKRIKALGVDGIITNYPDKAI